jgi:hypothetical protein
MQRSHHPAEALIMRKQRRARDFDVEAFIKKLDGMGMKLTAIPLADGKFRISRWCMMNANEHAEQIQDLWTKQIGDNQKRIDALAAHLAKATPWERARYISSGMPQVVAPDVATGPESGHVEKLLLQFASHRPAAIGYSSAAFRWEDSYRCIVSPVTAAG